MHIIEKKKFFFEFMSNEELSFCYQEKNVYKK